MTTSPHAGSAEGIGPQVGGYRLLEKLGEGGMGIVHLAEDEDGRRVAVKLLRPHVVGDRQARDRFAQEVSSLSRVRSDRVAEIIDADPWGVEPFVVTRYVAGPSLREHVRRHGPLTGEPLRRVAAGLAEALAAVHRVGVLHRDVKPGNVLVEDGEPVLIDFGLARMSEDTHLTSTGWLLGTPGYLAPEILYGDEPSPAADVHAWAATVVFAATGRPPAGTGPAMAVMDRVRRGEFDLQGVPAGLRPLLEQCLDAEPHQRPTIPELLGRIGAHQPPAPASEPTIVIERTRVLPPEPEPYQPEPYQDLYRPEPDQPVAYRQPYQEPYPPEPYQPQPMEPEYDGWSEPEPARRSGRQRAGLLGCGLATIALVACAPYLAAVLLAVLVALLRFASVVGERHARRRYYRGGARWWDAPASALFSPAYLLYSLAGTLLLLGWAAATVLATGLVLLLLDVRTETLVAVAAAVLVLCLWWGPGSGRVRHATRRLTRPLAGEGRAGPMLLLLGAALAVVLLVWLSRHGPVWSPATEAPWASGWLDRLRGALR